MSKIHAAVSMRYGGTNLVMASQRLSSVVLRRITSAGTTTTGAPTEASTEAPKMLKFRCGNGVEIATKAWGPPSSHQRAIALHGFLDNSNTFALLGPALAERGIHVVAIDFPGHGRSGPLSNDANYMYLNYTEYIIEAARWLGWPRFSLVGHSMGSWAGVFLAASFPEMIERCVFIDAIGPFSYPLDSSPKLLRRSIESRRALLGKKSKIYASFDDAVQMRIQAVPQWGEDQTMTWKAAALLVAGGTEPWQGDGHVRFTHDIMLRAPYHTYFSEESALGYIEAIECPCLLIRGDTGIVKTTPETLKRIAVMGDRLHDVVLPGSHHLHLDEETAPLVASHVVDFLLHKAHGREVSLPYSSI